MAGPLSAARPPGQHESDPAGHACGLSVGRRRRRADAWSSSVMTQFGQAVLTLFSMKIQRLNVVSMAALRQ
jgi:hypothetical protein